MTDAAFQTGTIGDPAGLSLAEIAAAIRARKISSREATEACLGRIAAWQPHINAFMRVEADEAVSAADEADRALAVLTARHVPSWVVGRITAGDGRAVLSGTHA